MYIFNRKKIIKQGRQYPDETITHPVLEHAAKTITERILWRNVPLNRILIMGHYLHVLTKHLLPFVNLQSEIVMQYRDCFFDSEFIPFDANTFDLIISFFDIQYLNDVPGHLKQLEYCLTPNGLITGVFPGGQSFIECAEHLFFEEAKNQKTTTVRFHPNISAPSIADLLKRAGFDCPITDKDSLTLDTDTIYNHIRTLRQLNAVNKMQEQHPFSRDIIPALQKQTPLSIDLLYITALGHQKNRYLE